jgi:hypothetical protein
MLALPEIDRIVKEAASAVYGPHAISRVWSKPVADSYGDDALSVNIVFARGQYEGTRRPGAALEALGSITSSLRDHGEERFPILSYATEEDLEQEALGIPDDDY